MTILEQIRLQILSKCWFFRIRCTLGQKRFILELKDQTHEQFVLRKLEKKKREGSKGFTGEVTCTADDVKPEKDRKGTEHMYNKLDQFLPTIISMLLLSNEQRQVQDV